MSIFSNKLSQMLCVILTCLGEKTQQKIFLSNRPAYLNTMTGVTGLISLIEIRLYVTYLGGFFYV